MVFGAILYSLVLRNFFHFVFTNEPDIFLISILCLEPVFYYVLGRVISFWHWYLPLLSAQEVLHGVSVSPVFCLQRVTSLSIGLSIRRSSVRVLREDIGNCEQDTSRAEMQVSSPTVCFFLPSPKPQRERLGCKSYSVGTGA